MSRRVRLSLQDRLLIACAPDTAQRRAARLAAAGKAVRAFLLYGGLARRGRADAAYEIARCYLYGQGVPASRQESRRWLERAAEGGHVEAQALLAGMLLESGNSEADGRAIAAGALFSDGGRSDADFQSALNWAQRAAEGGSAQGAALVGHIRTSGPVALRDADEALRWFEFAAAQNNQQGLVGYALRLADKARDNQAQMVVLGLLQQASDLGSPIATYLMAVMFEQGIGTDPHPALAVRLYRQAAEAGVRAAQACWGRALIAGRHTPADPEIGESWLRRAALAGDADAAFEVAEIHLRNSGLPTNDVEAGQWLSRASDLGHNGAAAVLGALYANGVLRSSEPDAALPLLRRGGAAGIRNAQIALARLVQQGRGSAEDAIAVRGWFAEAAAGGDPHAALNLAVCLSLGIGGPRDDEQALASLRHAAEHFAEARDWYERMTRRGVEPGEVLRFAEETTQT